MCSLEEVKPGRPVPGVSGSLAVGNHSARSKSANNKCRLGLDNTKKLKSLDVMKLATSAVDQLRASNSACPSHPQECVTSPDAVTNEDAIASSPLSKEKKHGYRRETKSWSRKENRLKANKDEGHSLKEDKKRTQRVEVGYPGLQLSRSNTMGESFAMGYKRRGSRHFDDLCISRPASGNSKTWRGAFEIASRTETLKCVPDTLCQTRVTTIGHHRSLKLKQPRCKSRGVQTAQTGVSGEDKNIAAEMEFLRNDVGCLRKQNKSLRRQLRESADWEMQVMRAYNSLVEKHRDSEYSKQVPGSSRLKESRTETQDQSSGDTNADKEVPSLQPVSSTVTNRAELLHQSENIMRASDKTGSPNPTYPGTPKIDRPKDSERSEFMEAVPCVVISAEPEELGGMFWNECSRPRPKLVRSHTSPLSDKITPCSVPKKRATSMITRQGHKVDNVDFQEPLPTIVVVDEKSSDVSSIYEQFEISGDRHDMRFPWQRDVPVQCEAVTTREVSIQTDFEPCSECRLRRLSVSKSPVADEADSVGIFPGSMRKRSTVISSSRRSSDRPRPRLKRQNFSLDLSDFSGMPNGGPLVNGNATPGSPTGPFRSRSNRVATASRPLSDSDIVRSNSTGNITRQSSLFHRRKNADVSAAKSGITMHLTIDTGDPDSLPCSPCPSPIAKEHNSSNFQSRPQVIVTHHDDLACDAQSQKSSSNGSQDSLTSDSSSLRVPSLEFLQTKAIFKKDSLVSAGSDNEEEEPSALPPTSRIHQRRGAVISQVPPNSADCADEDGVGSGISCIQDACPGGTTSPPGGVLLFPPSIGLEHRCSIMSTASSTLASVAAVHLQDFIEASATSRFDCNGLNQENNDVFETKRKLHALFKKKFGKDKDKSMIDDITTVFTNFKIRDQDEFEFATYKDKHWRDVILEVENNNTNHLVQSPSQEEVKRRDKVWELFRSECVYLIEHILVLKNVFQEPLRALQCEGYLMYIEPAKIFANLDELSQVSASFCRDLIRMLLTKASRTEFCHTDAVVTAFAMFGNRVCPAYQRYCMNYSSALHYIEIIKKHEDFAEFAKLCEQDPRCKRLQLADLMVAPIQHVTKYPLLLKDIRERTENPTERASLNATLQAVEVALNELDGKVKWLGNFERLRELQQMITWSQTEEIDPKMSVPEFLKDTVARMSKSNLLASTKRTLLHEGPLTLIDGTKSSEIYVFLFDDMLLISKIRKNNAKKKSIPDGVSLSATPPVPRKRDGFSFQVHKAPVPLDRVTVVEIESKRAAASGIKHGFVLVQNSRYKQLVAAYTLTASDENMKQTWLTHLKNAREKWLQMLHSDEDDDFANDEIRRDRKRTL